MLNEPVREVPWLDPRQAAQQAASANIMPAKTVPEEIAPLRAATATAFVASNQPEARNATNLVVRLVTTEVTGEAALPRRSMLFTEHLVSLIG